MDTEKNSNQDSMNEKYNSMKTKQIIAVWLISLMCMPTDNLLQAIIALCVFSFSTWLLKKRKVEAMKEVKKFENIIYELINR